MLRVISENTKELYKNYLKVQAPCFDLCFVEIKYKRFVWCWKKLEESIFNCYSQMNFTVTNKHGFCQQNGPERGQVQDWYPNEKMVVVPVCLNGRCCFPGCVPFVSYLQMTRLLLSNLLEEIFLKYYFFWNIIFFLNTVFSEILFFLKYCFFWNIVFSEILFFC